MAITSNTDKINKAYKFFYRDGLKNSFLYFPLKKIQGLDVPSMGSYFPTREGLCTYAYNSKNKVPTFLQCSVHTSRQGKEDNLYINNVKYYGDFSMARFILPFSGRKYKLRQKKFSLVFSLILYYFKFLRQSELYENNCVLTLL